MGGSLGKISFQFTEAIRNQRITESSIPPKLLTYFDFNSYADKNNTIYIKDLIETSYILKSQTDNKYYIGTFETEDDVIF